MRVTVIGASMLALACGAGPRFERVAAPIALPQGPPQSTCEQEEWYELAPTRLESTTSRSGPYVHVHYAREDVGLAVYRLNDDDPQELEDIWPVMDEPELERAHSARREPFDRKVRHSLYWMGGGLVGMGAGIGTAVAVQDRSGTAAAVAGLTGLALGLVGVVVGLNVMPSVDEELDVRARRRLLMPEEDDFGAAQRGLDRANAQRRLNCGGMPLPALPQATESKPAAAKVAVPTPPAEISHDEVPEDAAEEPAGAPLPQTEAESSSEEAEAPMRKVPTVRFE
jgi:hypothetical protein